MKSPSDDPPSKSKEPTVEALFEDCFAQASADPHSFFADPFHRAILHTHNGRRAFDVLPLQPNVEAEVSEPRMMASFGAPAPEAPPVIGIDTEWVHIEGKSNRILSYQFALISGGQGMRGIVSCQDDLRLEMREFIGHELELAVKDGLLTTWPAHVIVAAHRTTAEISAFSDFADIKSQFDGVRKTFVTAGGEYRVTYRDGNRNCHKLGIKLIDTQHLTPGGKALRILGDLYKFPKIQLPSGTIEQMDVLQRDDPELFAQYAIRDAEISAYHTHRMREFNQSILGEYEVPLTLGSIGVKLLLKNWTTAGVDHHAVLGTSTLPARQIFDHKRGRFITTKPEKILAKQREFHEFLVTSCYHGGRNESYVFGITEAGVWTDYDLTGAYSTAMVAIKTPAYDQAYNTNDPAKFTSDCMGFALIHFQFPTGTRFPCLPVISANNHGLVFPLAGETYVGAPEIALALNMGAEIEILHGVIVPWANDTRPFEAFVKDAQARRGTEKGTFEDKMWREIANSLYGKTAQALRPKTAFCTRSGESKPIPSSQITTPFMAAHTTSVIRAVLGELLSRIPADRTVVCATTDGFLTNASRAEIDTSGPLCTLFADLRERLSGNREILEVKHKIKRVLCVKTRAQITVELIDGEKPILAKGGIWIPDDVDDHNDYMLQLFRDRTPETKLSVRMLSSLREIYTDECDLVSVTQDRRVNLDPDFKCELVDPIERQGLLFCGTRSWQTVDEFNDVRSQFEEWRRTRVLKTPSDWSDWREYQAGSQASKKGVRRAKGGVVDQGSPGVPSGLCARPVGASRAWL